MKTYWFKAKKYGYGWYPSTWQGWLILALYLGYVLYITMMFEAAHLPKDTVSIDFMLQIFLPTALLIYICYRTGEPAKWRWGDEKKKVKKKK